MLDCTSNIQMCYSVQMQQKVALCKTVHVCHLRLTQFEYVEILADPMDISRYMHCCRLAIVKVVPNVALAIPSICTKLEPFLLSCSAGTRPNVTSSSYCYTECWSETCLEAGEVLWLFHLWHWQWSRQFWVFFGRQTDRQTKCNIQCNLQ